jgi:hypothetical protein
MCREILPCLYVAGADPYIAELRNAGHEFSFQSDPVPDRSPNIIQ